MVTSKNKGKTKKQGKLEIYDVNHYKYCKSLEIIEDFYKWLYGSSFDFTMSITYLQYKDYLQQKFGINNTIFKK